MGQFTIHLFSCVPAALKQIEIPLCLFVPTVWDSGNSGDTQKIWI